jgi:hypothetical protein
MAARLRRQTPAREQSYAEARALESLGSKPLIVLTHRPKRKMVPNLPTTVLAKLEADDQRLQRSVKLSTRPLTRYFWVVLKNEWGYKASCQHFARNITPWKREKS